MRSKISSTNSVVKKHYLSTVVSRSYFYHRARLRLSDKYAGLRIAIADIFRFNHRCYGYRRIREALGRQQVSISDKVVRRLMKQECIAVATTKRRRFSSYQGEIGLAPETH